MEQRECMVSEGRMSTETLSQIVTLICQGVLFLYKECSKFSYIPTHALVLSVPVVVSSSKPKNAK
jgi:hypothetical protein